MITVIAGPTASGKTAMALAEAKKLGAEIVNADSQQVYRYFDIGTAKPSAQELAAVPHHVISCIDPLGEFSAAQYQRLADAAIADITSRGRQVVVVGGTGMYLRILLHGVVDAPGSDAGLRAELETHESAELHARLHEVDPETAARLPVADRVRIIRALEIHQLTGKPASVHRAEHAFAPDRYAHRLLVLNPDRAALYQAINTRTQRMFEGGLIEETKSLVARGYREAAPMRAVGYTQALKHLDGAMTLDEAIADTALKTRHYAKRQFTWFKKEPGAVFLAHPYRLEN